MNASKFSKLSGIRRTTLARLEKSNRLVPLIINNKKHYSKEQLEISQKFLKKKKFIGGTNLIDKNIILNSFDSYFAGLFYSDGTLYDYGGLGFQLKDKDLLEEIVSKFHPIQEVKKHKTRNIFCLYLTKKQIKERFKYFNFQMNKTYGFQIPKMNKESFKHCLRGWFDGDGSVSVRKNGKVRVNICGNKKILGNIQKTLYEEFGLYTIWSDDKRSEGFGILEINKLNDLSLFFDIIYNIDGIFLKRKKEILEKYLLLNNLL